MITTSQAKSTESKTFHRLARFVKKEAIALLLNREPEEIYRVDWWRHVIHVVGKRISRFVSYADLLPVLGVEPPTHADICRWRKRCAVQKQKHAPKFWVDFYVQKFMQVVCCNDLVSWGQLIGTIKQVFSMEALQTLRSAYVSAKYVLQKAC
ncbi:hypothetical protein [Gloeocapsopsis dulcis]|uniref:Uncharacterized protein n=1 Tax=Gloeocapsopsis dulcis AAB1 = 1H9 TaxID=1433147 RepID=A0A6N8FQ13_9CHRO|nr:hypothetical protein [Gloeocapsopsis dulcis]MUL35358.1 hypothetical protein [Gloeocapsopsis dulcis AAB1 = 1H9]WNN90439.1 hypothetical protein P0S91_04960 [Gloeocapsopsis dulcis]